ncbi:hypothetical protein [Veillonella caviae]|uniref:hypothetical protein n=1 Tax=Veillonella caviae TaxID=248316 RepID=UPI0023A8283D|nr:hypothetical protein [Veillonella caviae]MCI5707995.1 hypothetical protein [Veillonella caviae]MDY5716035.1 hypothetical protein [Veillonella caviae]
MDTTFNGFVLGILATSIATAIGTFINYKVNQYVSNKEQIKYHRTLALIFLICISDCLRHAKTSSTYAEFASWKFLPWEQAQLEIAKAYPNEFKEFINTVYKLSKIYSSNDVITIHESLEAIQSKIKQLT